MKEHNMNTQVSDLVTAWLVLNLSDRSFSARAIDALLGLVPGQPKPSAAGSATGAMALVPTPSVASPNPLPNGYGQRRPRILVPGIDPELFSSTAYRVMHGGGGTVLAYIAGCPGLFELYQAFATPFRKPGSTSVTCIDARMVSLAEDLYGSLRMHGHKVLAEPGYDLWEPASWRPPKTTFWKIPVVLFQWLMSPRAGSNGGFWRSPAWP